jgi:hypothetical protein
MNAHATWRAVAVATIMVTGAACAFVPPAAPTPLPPTPGISTPQAPAPTTLPTSRAALEVSSLGLRIVRTIANQNSISYTYEPTITLRETRGLSTVSIDAMFLTVQRFGVYAFGARSCGGTGWTIAPGGTSALTLHPACDITERVDVTGDAIELTVIYRDDRGDVGHVTATSIITDAAGGGPAGS